MRWSVNLPSTAVKIEQALIFTSRSSWKRQMLVTSKMTTPPSFLPNVDQRVGQRLDLAEQGRHLVQHGVTPRDDRCVGERQRDVIGVVGAEPVEVLGLHGVEVVGQEVDGGLVGSRHDVMCSFADAVGEWGCGVTALLKGSVGGGRRFGGRTAVPARSAVVAWAAVVSR